MRRGEWTQLGKEKLASSTLNTDIAKRLKIYEVPSAVQLDKSFEALPALVIPYFDLDGQPLSAQKGWPDFYRVRYLKKGNSFKDMATNKSQRYAQPPGTGTCAYFPATREWHKVAKDVRQDVVITEGEFKAASGCEAGYATIGLGGVWNFRNSNRGIFFLPELEKLDWRRRKVYICFDSDYQEKPQVCHAMNQLAEELMERGALVYVILLPDVVEKGKTGLDDYFLENTKEDFDELIEEAEEITLARALWRINEEVVYVENPGLVAVVADPTDIQKLSADKFRNESRWATASATERKVSKEGNITFSKVPAAPLWIRWPLRRSLKRITYAPGLPLVTDDNQLNQWPGWGVEPVKGGVEAFTSLVEFIFAESGKQIIQYFYDWLAYPLQNPGTKMFAAVVCHGLVQGTGKSLIGYTMKRIYGKNFMEIKNKHIEKGETWWAENKQFIMGDEISGKETRAHADALKQLITQEEVDINVKFIPQYTVPDCINYYFTSQHADSFFLEDTDRRFLVNEVIGPPMPEAFYSRYKKWLHGEGPAALFHWLLNRKISKDFNPFAAPPQTLAKQRMIINAKGELSYWIAQMLAAPSQYLVTGDVKHTRDLFTSKELTSFYKQSSPQNDKISPIGMGRALSAAGCVQACGGQALRGPDGKADRYFAIRNADRWKSNSNRGIAEKNIAMQPVKRTK